MRSAEFIREYYDYVLSLMDCSQLYELTAVEWREHFEQINEEHRRDIARGWYDSDTAPHIFTSEEIGLIIDELEREGYVKSTDKSIWYAILYDSDDTDYGYGSYNFEDAKSKLGSFIEGGYDEAHIAVIDMSGHEATCIDTLTLDDIIN